MLESIGIDIDAMPDLFYDFANDVEVSISDFYDMIKPQLESKDIIEKIIETITQLENQVEPTQSVISDFYSSLTDKEKEKLGNLDELIDDYVQMYEGTMSEEQYIENVLKCNL